MARAPADLEPYLAHVRRVLPVTRIHVRGLRRAYAHEIPRGQVATEIVLELPGKSVTLHLDVMRTHLGRAVAIAKIGALGRRAPEWLLLAPHVGAPLGAMLAAAGVNYVDLRGNCHLRLGGAYAAHVEGRGKGAAATRTKGVRAAGIRVLFALLAEPDLLGRPTREIARAAGTNAQTALDATRRLERAGAVLIEGRKRRWLPGGRGIGLGRFVADYATILRPALELGRFRTPHRTPTDLERDLKGVLGEVGGVWLGGTAAADRIAPHHRGAETVLHTTGRNAELTKRLRAVPDPQGTVALLGLPGPLATRGLTPETAHPLLVYADMLVALDDRVAEAAEMLRRKALPDLV